MSDSHTPSQRALSPLWALLLLPVGLGFGLYMGRRPIPDIKAPEPAPAVQSVAVVAHAEAPSAQLPQGTIGVTVVPSEPAPSATGTATEPKRGEYSGWTSFAGATSESQRTGKPVLLDFNAEWCPPCQAMKRELFEDGARAQIMHTTVIPVSIVDRAREEGSNPPEIESLQQRYGVQAFPTLVVFSPATGRTEMKRGFGDADAALRWIVQAAEAVK